jgi:hypothetical protein
LHSSRRRIGAKAQVAIELGVLFSVVYLQRRQRIVCEHGAVQEVCIWASDIELGWRTVRRPSLEPQLGNAVGRRSVAAMPAQSGTLW